MPKLPIITAQDMISVLQSEGFIVLRQKGSHMRLRHEDGRVVTVPVHAGCVLGARSVTQDPARYRMERGGPDPISWEIKGIG